MVVARVRGRRSGTARRRLALDHSIAAAHALCIQREGIDDETNRPRWDAYCTYQSPRSRFVLTSSRF